jgi:hypothetical protein
MAVPTDGTATLAATDHRVEHARLATREVTDLPRGIIRYQYPGVMPTITTTATEIFRLTNVPVVTGRLYLFSVFFRAIQNLSTTNGVYLNLKTPQTPSPVTGTTDLTIDALMAINSPNVGYGHFQWQQMFRAPTGNITIVIQASITGGAGPQAYLFMGEPIGNGHVSVRDIGPNRGGQ